MAGKSRSGKKSGNTHRKADAVDKDRLIAELKDRVAVLENELRLKQDANSQDITEHNRLEIALKASEKQLKARLNAILSPGEISEETLSDIMDIPALQDMADSFYSMTGVGISIDDLHGTILVGAGWQDICTKFHRCHPETIKNCIESDLHLSGKVAEGEYTLYKCKNGMWDIVTPIIVNNKHIANLFSGQFFFDDEVPDRDYFERQAAKYGFNKDDYLAAMDRAPRHSRDKIRVVMEFYIKFARMVSRLSFSNVQMARSLVVQKRAEEELKKHRDKLRELVHERTSELEAANDYLRNENEERKKAQEALRASEEKYRDLVENINDTVWQIDENFVFTYISPQIFNAWGYTSEEVVGKTPMDFMAPDEAERVSKILEDVTGKRDKLLMYENRHLRKDGRIMYLEVSGQPIIDENGVYRGYRGVLRDITKRKLTEVALQESENKFRVLAETSPAAIFLYQGEKYLYVNPMAETLTGYSRDELLTEDAWGWIHTDFRDLVKERAIRRQQGELMPARYEVKYSSKDGREGWVDFTAGKIEYEGQSAGLAMAFDVSERKRAEEKLVYLASFPELNTSPIIEIDDNGTVTYYNPAAKRMCPGMVELGANHPMVKGIELNRDKISKAESRQIVRDVEINGIFYQQTILRMPERRTTRIYCIDITERKRAEQTIRESSEMLRLVMKNIPQRIFWKDIRSVYMGCNDNFAIAAGVGSPENIVGKTDYDLAWTREESEAFRRDDREVMDTDRPNFHIIEPQRQADGTQSWLDTNKVPLHDAQGKVFGILGTYEDITDRRLAEIQLNEAKAQAELYLDLMGHDITNMNQALMGYLEMMDPMRESSEIDKGLIDSSIEIINRSSRMINDVKKLTQLHAGKVSLKNVDVCEIMCAVKNKYSNIPGRSVTINYCPGRDCIVRAGDLLKDVFENLVDNAIRHSRGPVVIDLAIDRVKLKGQSFLKFTVSDNGPGIPDELKKKILMSPEEAVEKTARRGFGLYLVRTLIDHYHGQVWVEDRVPGDQSKGARFVVMLPALDH